MSFMERIANLFGRGEDDTLRVPAMDGVLKPNNLLDAADRLLDLPAIDNLAIASGKLLCSSGDTVFVIDAVSREAVPLHRFGGAVTMIAASPTGRIAVCIEGRGIETGSLDGDWRSADLPPDCRSCVTAGVFRDEDTLVLTVGSRKHPWSEWKRDLMSHGTSGRVLEFGIATGKTSVLADGLAFPYGIVLTARGPVVSESWRHRLIWLRSDTPPAVVMDDLPAYPARLSPASAGGFWLALFAPRRQLTELVLREDDYRSEMMATIPPEAWIGPDFADGGSLSQPLQSGAVRQMGVLKPWAPSRSYGMVVRLDHDMAPVASFHSRADGRIHGIASVAEVEGKLYAAARGPGTLIAFDPARGAFA